MTNLLDEATATLNEIIRINRINGELLETLSVTATWLKHYAERHDIQFPDSSTYESLLNKANTLIEELSVNQLDCFSKMTTATIKHKTDGSYHEPHNRRKVNRTADLVL